MPEEETAEVRSRIDWAATAAGAAAAVTVAVLLSTLGAAGTLVGAALGSVIATVSSTLYKQGIHSSRRRMAAVQAAALEKVNLAEQELRRARRTANPQARAGLDRASEQLDAASSELEEEATAAPAPGEAEPRWWAEVPWRKVTLLAVAIFLVALLVISIVELIAGRSVSSITGGTEDDRRTSLTGIFGDRPDRDKPQKDRIEQQPADQTSTPPGAPVETTGQPTDTAPVTDSTSPTVAPTDAATPTAPDSPADSPSGTPTLPAPPTVSLTP